MSKENSFLREVFPKEFWANETGEAMPYDFRKNWKALNALAKKYLASCLFDIPVEPCKEQAEHENWVSVFGRGVLNGKFDAIHISKIDDISDIIAWLNSVYQFFRLGCEKQNEKKSPKVYISW